MKSYNSVDDITPRSLERFKARVFNQTMPLSSAFRVLMIENNREEQGEWKTSLFFDVFREIFPDAPLGEFVGGFEKSGFLERHDDASFLAFDEFLLEFIEQIKKDSQER